MKIVKLSTDLVAEWRENICWLVADDGQVLEPVARDLEAAAAGVARIARNKRRTHDQTVAFAGKRHDVSCKIVNVGRNDGDLLEELRIDGHRVVTARDIICARMLEEHGECQLRHQNGVLIKIVRDPTLERTTYKQSLQIAPRPEHCPCVSWGRPHVGTHHHTCQWNKLAPPDERASEPEVVPKQRKLAGLASRAGSGLQTPGSGTQASEIEVRSQKAEARAERPAPAVVEASPLDPPESCRNGCRDWAVPHNRTLEDGQHHPMCTFYDAWKLKTAKTATRWLVDLSTGEKIRPASDEEIAQADVAHKRQGSPLVQTEAGTFAVLDEKELEEEPGADSQQPTAEEKSA